MTKHASKKIKGRNNKYLVTENHVIKLRDNLYTIPKYYSTDLVTVPGWLNRYFDRLTDDNNFLDAALVHDFAIDHGYLIINEIPIIIRSRKKIDSIFHEILLSSGVNKYLALVMYKLVRLWSILNRHQ